MSKVLINLEIFLDAFIVTAYTLVMFLTLSTFFIVGGLNILILCLMLFVVYPAIITYTLMHKYYTKEIDKIRKQFKFEVHPFDGTSIDIVCNGSYDDLLKILNEKSFELYERAK